MSTSTSNTLSARSKYIRLGILVLIAGNIYPLIYLRQNFEVSILQTYGIDAQQLGQLYSMLGIIYIITYLPSGWLADRVAPRILMSFSLAAAGLLGIWFSTVPSFTVLLIIFSGWGLAAGLTFWAALIKATALLAAPSEQGRFFGILEAGRGLVEAILASIALTIFAYYTQNLGQDTQTGLNKVVWMYIGCMLLLAPTSFFLLNEGKSNETGSNQLHPNQSDRSMWEDLKIIGARVEIWLCGICILTGYQLFWATYSFSAYLQNVYGLTAVTVGSITVAKLWMRPIGAGIAGFVGDFLNREKVLGGLLVFGSLALSSLAFLPASASATLLLMVVLLIGLLTYAIRGIYWATLESCGISNKIKGLAIGVLSLVGYSPYIYLPSLRATLIDEHPPQIGYGYYYGIIACMGIIGAFAAWYLAKRTSR